MRIIKDETKNETIVKCPSCKSIFSYTQYDVDDKFPPAELRCPCCDTKHIIWEYLEVNNA